MENDGIGKGVDKPEGKTQFLLRRALKGLFRESLTGGDLRNQR
jgi:hypothetical protein